MADLRIARVTKMQPKAHAVDLVYLDSGAAVPMVQVLAGVATTNSGHFEMPEPTPAETEGDLQPTNDRDIYAIVGSVGGIPVVLGFIFPQVSQMMFADANRRLNRHASDVYSTITDAGDMEIYHPSGTMIRIAEDPEHEDLTGKDFDQKFKLKRNTDRNVHVRVVVMQDGEQTADLHLTPGGDLTINLERGTVVTAPAGFTVDAPVATFTGSVIVDSGATGTFATGMGSLVTVQDGIVTNIT